MRAGGGTHEPFDFMLNARVHYTRILHSLHSPSPFRLISTLMRCFEDHAGRALLLCVCVGVQQSVHGLAGGARHARPIRGAGDCVRVAARRRARGQPKLLDWVWYVPHVFTHAALTELALVFFFFASDSVVGCFFLLFSRDHAFHLCFEFLK